MEKDTKKLDSKSEKAKVVTKKNKTGSKTVTEVKAAARFIRVAPRKVRLVIRQLVGLEVVKALDYLRFVNKSAVKPVTKLLQSAIANAENNFQLDKNDLYIKKIIANDGPVLKRWRPRARGRSAPIQKRTSHIEVILGVRPGAKKGKVVKKENGVISQEVKIVKPDEIKKSGPKVSSKGPAEKGKGSKGFLRGMFQRKTG